MSRTRNIERTKSLKVCSAIGNGDTREQQRTRLPSGAVLNHQLMQEFLAEPGFAAENDKLERSRSTNSITCQDIRQSDRLVSWFRAKFADA